MIKLTLCYNIQFGNSEMDVEMCIESLKDIQPERKEGFGVVDVQVEAESAHHKIEGSYDSLSSDEQGVRQSSLPTFLKVNGISVPLPSSVEVDGKNHNTKKFSPFAEKFRYPKDDDYWE